VLHASIKDTMLQPFANITNQCQITSICVHNILF